MRDLVWLDRLMILYMYPFNLFWYIRWDLSSKRLYYYFHLVRSSASRSIHNNSLPLFSFLLLSDTLSPFFTLWAVLVQESEQTLNNLWTFQIPSRIKRAIFSSTASARIERAGLGLCWEPAICPMAIVQHSPGLGNGTNNETGNTHIGYEHLWKLRKYLVLLGTLAARGCLNLETNF